MVPRELAHPESRLAQRCAAAVHRRPRLARAALLRALVKLAELKSKGYFNDDITSKELYQGIQLYDTGKASMCFNTTPSLPNSQKKLGADTVGFMKLPTFGQGGLAEKHIRDTQGFGIPAKGKIRRTAGKFYEFMHSPEQVQAMWALSQQIPANEKFDSSVIDVPLIKTTYDTWMKGDNTDYIADLMPTKFWTDAMFVNSQKILGGKFSGEQAADLAHDVTETWKKQNPDMVANYQTWRKTSPDGDARGSQRPPSLDAAHASLDPVPLRRARGRAAGADLRLPAGEGVRVLAQADPRHGGPVVGWLNYELVWDDPVFHAALKHSVLLLLAVPVLVLISIVFSVLLYERARGWRIYRSALFMPYILAVPIIGIIASYVFALNGALNELLRSVGLDGLAINWIGSERYSLLTVGIVIVWREVGFGIVLFLARLLSHGRGADRGGADRRRGLVVAPALRDPARAAHHDRVLCRRRQHHDARLGVRLRLHDHQGRAGHVVDRARALHLQPGPAQLAARDGVGGRGDPVRRDAGIRDPAGAAALARRQDGGRVSATAPPVAAKPPSPITARSRASAGGSAAGRCSARSS